MNLLQPGITGFWMHGEQQVASVDLKQFKTVCYAAAQTINMTVSVVDSAYQGVRITHNYHRIVLTALGATANLQVLCNAQYPIVAFADQHDTFIDVPELRSFFVENYTIAMRSELYAPIIWSDPRLAAQLRTADILQLKSWKPSRIADIVFNEWD